MSFRERAERNSEFRTLHHHVFDSTLVFDAMQYAGFDVISGEPFLLYHIAAVGRNRSGSPSGDALDRRALKDIIRRSPFQTDSVEW